MIFFRQHVSACMRYGPHLALFKGATKKSSFFSTGKTVLSAKVVLRGQWDAKGTNLEFHRNLKTCMIITTKVK